MPKLDFNGLSATDFEEFCFHLLSRLSFVNVDWRKGTGHQSSPADSGRDNPRPFGGLMGYFLEPTLSERLASNYLISKIGDKSEFRSPASQTSGLFGFNWGRNCNFQIIASEKSRSVRVSAGFGALRVAHPNMPIG